MAVGVAWQRTRDVRRCGKRLRAGIRSWPHPTPHHGPPSTHLLDDDPVDRRDPHEPKRGGEEQAEVDVGPHRPVAAQDHLAEGVHQQRDEGGDDDEGRRPAGDAVAHQHRVDAVADGRPPCDRPQPQHHEVDARPRHGLRLRRVPRRVDEEHLPRAHGAWSVPRRRRAAASRAAPRLRRARCVRLPFVAWRPPPAAHPGSRRSRCVKGRCRQRRTRAHRLSPPCPGFRVTSGVHSS